MITTRIFISHHIHLTAIIMILLLTGLTTGGCSITNDDPVVEVVIEVSNQTPEVGERVTLDGNNSIVEQVPATFAWELVKPGESIAVIEEPVARATAFTPDVEGDYQVILTITTEELEDTRSVIVTAVSG